MPSSIGSTFKSGGGNLGARRTCRGRICNDPELVWPSVDAHRPDGRADIAARFFVHPMPSDDRGIHLQSSERNLPGARVRQEMRLVCLVTKGQTASRIEQVAQSLSRYP